jgi:hypothetical protein
MTWAQGAACHVVSFRREVGRIDLQWEQYEHDFEKFSHE